MRDVSPVKTINVDGCGRVVPMGISNVKVAAKKKRFAAD